MTNTNKLLEAVQQQNSLVVNSVSVEDTERDGLAVVIHFTSDGDERTKTMPLTEEGLKVKAKIEKLFADERFDPNFIWSMIKPDNKSELSGILVGLVRDKAKEARERVAGLASDFASIRLNDTGDVF